MGKHIKIRFTTCLLLLVSLVGCASPGEEKSSPSISETEAFSMALSTAIAQTEEARSTTTPTPHPTDTPAPSPSPVLFEELSAITLDVQDLPETYSSIDAFEAAFYENQIRSWYMDTDFTVGSSFFFNDEESEQTIIGWTILLPERFAGTGFDVLTRYQEHVFDMVVIAFDGEEIVEKTNLPTENELGDHSLGISMLVIVKDDPNALRIDAFLFQRQTVAVIVVGAYLDHDSPQIQIDDVAKILDRKILDVLTP